MGVVVGEVGAVPAEVAAEPATAVGAGALRESRIDKWQKAL